VQYVDPFIGTGGRGHHFRGRRCPRLVQLSPDSGKQGRTGVPAITSPTRRLPGSAYAPERHGHRRSLRHSRHADAGGRRDACNRHLAVLAREEKASPGYYSVDLQTYDIRAELTATAGSACTGMRSSGRRPAASLPSHSISVRHQRDEPSRRRSPSRARRRLRVPVLERLGEGPGVFFVARFSTPFQTWLIGDPRLLERAQAGPGETRPRLFRFVLRPGQPLSLKVGSRGERRWRPPEPRARNAGLEFDGHRRDAATAWERKLQRVRSRRRTGRARRSLHGALSLPAGSDDVQRRGRSYRGSNGDVQPPAAFQNHTVFSLWDTFRACTR